MSAHNGKRRPPRPRIELVSSAASPGEAAAIVAAIEQFLADTAPAPRRPASARAPWQRAALEEGIAARQVERLRLGPRAALSLYAGPQRIEHGHRPSPGRRSPRGERMAVVKIIELVGSSKTSTDDAAKQALTQAQTSLRNIRAVDIVSTGIRGENLDEYRAHVRVAFLIEDSDVD